VFGRVLEVGYPTLQQLAAVSVGPNYFSGEASQPIGPPPRISDAYRVTASGPHPGDTFGYTITGISAADIVGGSLTGTLTLDQNLEASVTISISADQSTEGVERMAFAIAGQSVSVDIRDTSIGSPPDNLAPTINLSSSKLTLNRSETATITFTLSEPSIDFTVSDLTVTGGTISNFSGSGASYTATFSPAANTTTATVKVASGTFSDAAGNFNIDGADANNTVTLSVDTAPIVPPGTGNLTGIAYHWKSHALLGGISVSARGGAAPAEGALAPIQLKNLTWDASGLATVEVWAHTTGVTKNLGFVIDLGLAASTAAFVQSSALSGWSSVANASSTEFALAGFSSSNATHLSAGDIKLGVLSLNTGSAEQLRLELLFGEVAAAESTPYALSLARATSDTSGGFAFTELDHGIYLLGATRGAGDTGFAISSADALAALQIAVGLNPNSDPDGADSKPIPRVSPYQIMAADINGDGKVTSSDALGILKMAINRSDAPAKEWFFVEESRDLWNEAAGTFSLTRSDAGWDRELPAVLDADGQAINLVGVLKGDVNGNWAPPAGSQDLDLIDPGYFQRLSNLIGSPLDQWHV
jgi:hypothetical protein